MFDYMIRRGPKTAPQRGGEAWHEEPRAVLTGCQEGIKNPAVNVVERFSRSDRLLNR